jgi:hypothetical protein
VRPYFTVEEGTMMTALCRCTTTPPAHAPDQTARYTIVAPSLFAMPSVGKGFQVPGFALAPPSLGRTHAYVASLWRVVLQPAAINGRLDQPMRALGLPVYLGQAIHAHRGLQFSEAIINKRPEGQTPVAATMNAQGFATMAISSPVGGSNPVDFETNLVMSCSGYPYAYSPILVPRLQP